MRSSFTTLTADKFTSAQPHHPSQAAPVAGRSPSYFSNEIAAAAQVFANGLVEMWTARHELRAASPVVDLQERRALIASLTDRVDALAKRTTFAMGRPRTAGGALERLPVGMQRGTV